MHTVTTSPATTAPESVVRILKVATCSSVSGKSKLTYHVGCAADSELQFRIFGNSAAGAFNQDWVSLSAIRQAVAKAPGEKEITSFHLHPLYRGKSVNTPSFLLAVLKSEGLVQSSTTKRRCHEWVDEARFVAEMKAWAASGKEAKVEDSATKDRGKPTKGRGKLAKQAVQLQSAEVKPDEPSKVEAESKPQPSEGKPQPSAAKKGTPTKVSAKSRHGK